MLIKPKGQRNYGDWMTKTVWMTISNYVRHNDREGLADYLYRAMSYTIAHTMETDWTDPDRYICVDELPTLGIICPHCGEESVVSLREIAQDEAKKYEAHKSNREKVHDRIMASAKEWNSTSSKRVPYAFVEWLKEKI